MGSAIGVQKRGLLKAYRKEAMVEISFERPTEGEGEHKNVPGRRNGRSKGWWQEV